MRAKLFVGNLNYQTTTETLESVFRSCHGYSHAKICYDRQTGKPLGYAVVHFTSAAAAQHAIDTLNNAEIDGRHIVVAPYRSRVSDPTQPRMPPVPRGPTVATANQSFGLILDLHKNATWMDLKDMLSQFGKVLFVDEPRIMRVAVAHFARQEDRDQVLSGLKSASGLGGQIEMAPIDAGSQILSGHGAGPMPEAGDYYGGYQAPPPAQGYAYPYATAAPPARPADYGGFVSVPTTPGWLGQQPYGDAGFAPAQQLQSMRAVQGGAPGPYGYMMPPRGGGPPEAERGGLRHTQSQPQVDKPPANAPGGGGMVAPSGVMLGGYGAAGDAPAALTQGQGQQMRQAPSTPELQQMMQHLALQPLPQPPPPQQ